MTFWRVCQHDIASKRTDSGFKIANRIAMIAQTARLWDDPVMDQSQRLDKWLWCARFHKTRALAVEAIQGGHVHVNGQRLTSSPA